jgi:iron complex outermembrane receptor protein/hemoglobin/transferrin/lactoferrin receptor protein
MAVGSIGLYQAAASAQPLPQPAALAERKPPAAEGITVTVQGTAKAGGPTNSFHDAELGPTELARKMPLGLADALRHAPSASVQQTSPTQATIYVRGVSGRELAHSLDGVRLNSTIFRAGNNPFIGLVDAYSLVQVEIKPGANGVLYGSDAIGGAILMHTRVPELSEAGPFSSARLLQTLSSNPLGGASRADASYSTYDWALRLGFTRMEAGAIRPGENERSPLPESYVGARREPGAQFHPALAEKQVGTEFQQLAGDATLHVRLPARLSLIGRAQHSLVPNLVRYDQITPRFKNELPDRAESSLAPLRRSTASVELTRQAPREPGSSLILSWQRLSERAHFRDLSELCADSTASEDCEATSVLIRDPERSIEYNRSDAFGLAGRTQLVLGPVTLAAGAAAHHEIVRSRTIEEVDGQPRQQPAMSRFPDGSSASDIGAFAMPTLALGASVSLSVGGRATLHRVAIAAREGPNSAPESHLTLVDWSGQALLEWLPIRGLTVGVSWGRALRPPNVQDLATQGTRARGRYQVPNDSLGAEHGQSADLGFKFRRLGTLLQATLFYQRNTDAIVLAPTTFNGLTTTTGGDVYYSSLNASSVQLYGLEARGQVQLHRLFAPFSRFLAMQGEQSNPAGTDLPPSTLADRAPPVQGELGFRSQPTDSIGTELLAAFRLKQDRLNDPINVEDNRIPAGGTPGFVSYHARVDWRIRSWLRARLNFDNISNALILEHGSGFYRAGFSVSGMLELTLDQRASE